MDVTVAVATCGDTSWARLAEQRAIPNAQALGVPVVHVHAAALHEARNDADDQVATEWVIHLDADDQLLPGYVDAMAAGTADLRAPSVMYLREPGRVDPSSVRAPAPPYVPVQPARLSQVPKVAGHDHHCTGACLPWGNWLVVGTAVRVDLVRKVGGWRDYNWSEDWDLWLRCHLAGATVEAIPSAVYLAYVRRYSRNRGATRDAKLAAHRAIAEANGVPVP